MSSLKDLASLIMIPSLYKDGELHTVKPLADENIIVHPDATDNNDGVDGTTPSTSSNFTFSRGSNLAATRVDVNGLIEKGRENLLTYSNAFSNAAWTKVNASVASGQADKDGGTDAWKISSSASGSSQIFMSGSNTNMKTHSIYAKAGSVSVLKIWVGSNKEFDLSNGTTSSTNSKITDVGNGWYRCEVFDVFSNYNPFFTATAAGDFVYIQDAQLEQGLVATDYIETGTSAAQSGILEDMPRLDYSGGASCPSLLLEPQRTNLALHSEYFGNSFWFKKDASVVDNSAISPEGVQNATKLVESTSSSTHYIRSGFMNTTDGSTLTTSLFVKAGERTEIALFEDGWNGHFVYADLVAESVTTSGIDADIESLENGWFRIYIIDVARPSTRWQIRLGKDGTTDYQGDGTSGIYIYGFQMENQASYPTSYIPTYGTSQTRSHDVCKISGTDATAIVDKPAMTLFAEVNHDTANTNTTILSNLRKTSGGSYGDFISFIMRNNSQFQIEVRSNNTAQGTIQSSAVSSGTHKVAAVVANDNLKLFVDGVLVGSDTSVTLPTGLNEIYLGGYPDTNVRFGTKKSYLYFPTALTDSECIALTTL